MFDIGQSKSGRACIFRAVIEDYKKEDWVSLYQSALIELEQARLAGRINAAQKAIVARVELLRGLPGLHAEERVALDDALRALASLQREEAHFDAEAERRAVEESLEKLRSVGHTIQRLRERANNPE
jgi:hypothetical protein